MINFPYDFILYWKKKSSNQVVTFGTFLQSSARSASCCHRVAILPYEIVTLTFPENVFSPRLDLILLQKFGQSVFIQSGELEKENDASFVLK